MMFSIKNAASALFKSAGSYQIRSESLGHLASICATPAPAWAALAAQLQQGVTLRTPWYARPPCASRPATGWVTVRAVGPLGALPNKMRRLYLFYGPQAPALMVKLVRIHNMPNPEIS